MTRSLLSARSWLFVSALLCTATYLIRLSGPSDLESYAQVLNVGYILDLMNRGNWIVQYDLERAIMSKPPLHTWLMAPFTATLGLNRLALTLPSFLSILALAALVLVAGRRRFGLLAGGLAACAVVLAPTMAKQAALVRTDPVFMLVTAAAALAAFAAWDRGPEKGRPFWLLFWFGAALTTLIKGPLGVLLAAGGLLAHFWEKRDNPQHPAPHGPHMQGLLLFILLAGGWFLAAWLHAGQALIDKMLHAELIGHAVGEHSGGWQFTDLFKPTFFLFLRYLPFSLAVFYALWRVIRHPASDPGARRFERFLTCWLLVGLVVFSLAKHQRADHLLPLWPACALLAGRELARLATRTGEKRFLGIGTLVALALLATTYANIHSSRSKGQGGSDYARELRLARDAELAATTLRTSGIDLKRLHHVDTPLTLQLYLGTFRQYETPQQLDAALRSGPIEVALGASEIGTLKLATPLRETTRLLRWPAEEDRPPVLQVYRLIP